VLKCKSLLLDRKEQLLNSFIEMRRLFYDLSHEKGGDEMDQSSRLQEEKSYIRNQKRIEDMLHEIECALMRIEKGIYGICEITNEPIEEQRLLLIPWTRYSIEGAEAKEEKII
jgi:DnaK suppressor protein